MHIFFSLQYVLMDDHIRAEVVHSHKLCRHILGTANSNDVAYIDKNTYHKRLVSPQHKPDDFPLKHNLIRY